MEQSDDIYIVECQTDYNYEVMEDETEHLTIDSYEVYYELIPMEEMFLGGFNEQGDYELDFDIEIDVEGLFGDLDQFMNDFDFDMDFDMP